MIRPVTNIDNVYITDQFEPLEMRELERAGISRNTMRRYEAAINPKVPFRYRLQQFMAAENEAGRIAKVVKDVAVFFLPFGKKIETATDIIDHITQKEKPMGSILKRAFGTEGGGWIAVRNDDGEIDTTAILASIIRLGLLLLVVWGANQLEVYDAVAGILGL